MQNIKANGNKFLVEMKNDQGEYEYLGVLTFKQATEMQFTTHRAVRLLHVSDTDPDEKIEVHHAVLVDNDVRVGDQLFTRGELRKAIDELIENVKSTMVTGETLSCYDLRNGYSTTEKRDLCENEWPDCMALNFEDVNACLMKVFGRITEGNLEVYFNDMGTNSAYDENHGIWITDGVITKIY